MLRRACFVLLSAFAMTCNGPLASMCDDPRRDCNNPTSDVDHISDFRYSDPARRPTLAIPVHFRNVIVIGVDDFLEPSPNGKVGDIFVEERIADGNFPGCVPDPVHGGRVCGIQLYSPTTIPAGTHMALGDMVNVSGGEYEEFNCATCGTAFPDNRTLPEIGTPTVERVGSGLPLDPVDVTIAQLTDPDHGDDYVGILVRITDTVMTAAPDRYGAMSIGVGITITPQLTPLNDPTTGATIPAGTQLRNIVGIASYFYGTKIIPRSVHDYEIVR